MGKRNRSTPEAEVRQTPATVAAASESPAGPVTTVVDFKVALKSAVSVSEGVFAGRFVPNRTYTTDQWTWDRLLRDRTSGEDLCFAEVGRRDVPAQ